MFFKSSSSIDNQNLVINSDCVSQLQYRRKVGTGYEYYNVIDRQGEKIGEVGAETANNIIYQELLPAKADDYVILLDIVTDNNIRSVYHRQLQVYGWRLGFGNILLPICLIDLSLPENQHFLVPQFGKFYYNFDGELYDNVSDVYKDFYSYVTET